MFNYCTLFDLKYLSRGVALYDSLIKVKAKFHLYILAMDDSAVETLKHLKLKHATIIPLSEFEDADLRAIKSSRTRQEYCWTCTPSIIRYCLLNYELKECTYLDADIYFFDNPAILHREMDNKSILITDHHYFPKFDQSSTSGKYCVQFITFRNDKQGLTALEWWRQACNTWCYARVEDGKFGDQKYLDDWTKRFKGVHVLKNHGGGIAPWNIQNYDMARSGKRLKIRRISDGKLFPVIFYHFHDLYFDDSGNWFHKSGSRGYAIGSDVYSLIYADYLTAIFKRTKDLKASGTDLPTVPDALTDIELESILIPALSDLADKAKLRSHYEKIDNSYRLKKANHDDGLFGLLLKAGYHLNRFILSHQPGNYVYEEFRSQNLQNAELLTALMKIRSNLFYRVIVRVRNLLLFFRNR